MNDSVRFNVQTMAALRRKPPASYEIIRIDTNNDCNVRCVYCHNERSSEMVELEDFRSFLEERVISARDIQIGCVMEPTLDPRMCDFMLAIAASPARPSRMFRLQSNGILLHRHDFGRMVQAGLNLLTVSVDSATTDNHKLLRGGTSLPKVQRNLIEFRKACPSVRVRFITTVTSVNIGDIDGLVTWGLEHGVEGFEFRQMFHYPDSPLVDHAKMRALEVTFDEFAAMRDRVRSRFPEGVRMTLGAAETITRVAAAVTAASGEAAAASG